ncbi:hypothetical protein TRICI_000749 [Trichomonascus ciferrii]|uniref:Malate synthase n=1 Tax=Trichomonascus ciferrii TaxID=44093 RepID=A0A642VBP3_9ASCO|nr:hypothetical protein TRICI_000749 [Trichomonascus ciferrii]
MEGIELFAGSLEGTSPYGSGTTPKTILTKEAVAFAAGLQRKYNRRREELLAKRPARRDLVASGKADFSSEIAKEWEGVDWKGADIGPGLEDRRVEITGPPERKMIVNALNSGVCTYMSDFEDSMSPTWNNVIWGQVHLYDAIRLKVDFNDETSGKEYKVKDSEKIPVILVRPRGWHMEERHMTVDGKPMSASIFDFALYFYHNAHKLINDRHWGPYFYLPKMESHHEAKLWNDIFNDAQDQLNIPRGTIRATVLIETLSGAYDMEGIIYQLRDHMAGLNCGRWDYIFSTVKTFMNDPKHVLPDRADVTMTVGFMSAYVHKLIEVCHRRGVHAMGGMAAQIPIKNDPEANELAMQKVRSDKEREVKAGHDGTWVAHPALAKIAFDVFNKYMPQPNQIGNDRRQYATPSSVSSDDLINTKIPDGRITEQGLKTNVYIGLCYMQAWLCGSGCVPINYLMEDAATAEVSRSQVYQWALHGVKTDDSNITITTDLVCGTIKSEASRLKQEICKSDAQKDAMDKAAGYWINELTNKSFNDFLTTPLYDVLVKTPTDKTDLLSLV